MLDRPTDRATTTDPSSPSWMLLCCELKWGASGGVIGVCYNGHYEEREGRAKKPTKNRRQTADTLVDLQCASVNMCPRAIPMHLHVLKEAAELRLCILYPLLSTRKTQYIRIFNIFLGFLSVSATVSVKIEFFGVSTSSSGTSLAGSSQCFLSLLHPRHGGV